MSPCDDGLGPRRFDLIPIPKQKMNVIPIPRQKNEIDSDSVL